MANAKKRVIRFDQFARQLDETGLGDLQPVEVNGDGDKIYLKLGVGLDVEGTNAVNQAVGDADTAREAAEAILGYHPTMTADEQIELMEANGFTCEQLIALWGSSTQGLRDDMGKLRPKKS